MSELGSLLREHYEAASPPIDVEALVTARERTPSTRWRLIAAVALGGATLAVVIVVQALVAGGPGEAPVIAPAPSNPPATRQPTQPTDPTTSPDPASSTIGDHLVWTRVERPDLQPDWFATPLWSDGTTIYYGPPDGWYSTDDGSVWETDQRHLDHLLGPAGAVWNGRVLAVSEPSRPGGPCVEALGVRLATGGATAEQWPLPLDAFELAGCVAVGTESVEPGLSLGPVALGPRGAIVLAIATPTSEAGGTATDGSTVIAWRSTDLTSWQPVAELPDVLPVEDESIHRPRSISLVATSDGFVAIGWDGRVWFTADGASWRQVAEAPDLEGGAWAGTSRGQAVAVGRERVWRLGETGATPLGDVPTNGQLPEHVAIGDAGVVIVLPQEPDSGGEVLFSRDGSAWDTQARPSSWGTLAGWTTRHPVAVGRDVVIVMTETDDGRGDDVELWVGR